MSGSRRGLELNSTKKLAINIKLKRVEQTDSSLHNSSSDTDFDDSGYNHYPSLPRGLPQPHSAEVLGLALGSLGKSDGEANQLQGKLRDWFQSKSPPRTGSEERENYLDDDSDLRTPPSPTMSTSSSSEFVKQKLNFLIPEKDQASFKTAVYTGIVFVVLGLCGLGLWATYHLLLAFIKPIMWAVLAGTVLFPLKQSVTNVIRGWLKGLRDSNTPLVIGTVSLPFKWLDLASQKIWDIVSSSQVFFVVGGYVGLQVLTIEGVFVGMISKTIGAVYWLDGFIDFLASKWVIPFFILYFVIYVTWLYLQPEEGTNKNVARILSVPIWLGVLTFFAQFFGPFQPIVMLAASATVALIAAGLVKSSDEETEPTKESEVPSEPVAEKTVSEEKPKNMGNAYLKGIFGACLLLWAVKHTWVTAILLIPFFFAILKKTGAQLGLWSLLSEQGSNGCDFLKEKFRRVVDIAVPRTIRKFARVLFVGDQMVVKGLESKMDLISSVVVMISMVIAGIFFIFFVIFQVHGEVVHLIRLGGNILSAEDGTVMGAVNFTGTKLSEHDIDGYVDDAYQYGRGYLTSKVRQLADPSDVARADMLEAQVKLLMDQLFEMWTQTPSPSMGSKHKHETSIWSLRSMDYTTLMAETQTIVMENLEALQSIMTSVWSVVSANVAFISSLFGAFAFFILSFFMELLNFVIETVVFLTCLFYLLASSTSQWKPLEWLSSLAPPGGKKEGVQRNLPEDEGWGVSKAVEEAISGVFELSSKMCVFYGLYTWFMHSLFGLNIVFVPSLLAALFAAVPLTAPYMVSLLGFLELWLVRDELYAALIFLLASVAPMMFADTAFYSEVKGSHPYVTGLAIVGGIYWLGLEGAIIGPIMLCCIVVLFKMMLMVRSSVAAGSS